LQVQYNLLNIMFIS